MFNQIEIHNKNAFLKMHNAGRLAAEVLDYITNFVKIGVTTEILDNLCHEFILKQTPSQPL